jgi:geranylgeranyl diphosphate synthase type I
LTDLPRVAAEGRSAREVLAWSRNMVDPALRLAVDELPGSVRRIAGYHFGWWDEHGRPLNAESGKAVRPALSLLAAEAVGGDATAGVPPAVAVELVHNFSILHDDVMDHDTTRRHRPTAWTVFGTDAAILAGDALLTLAFDVLAVSGHPAAPQGLRMLSDSVLRLLDGQGADLAFERRDDVTLAECLAMAKGKTGALIGGACGLGALFGGGDHHQVDQLRDFGEHLGLAYQFVDDLLGIWGDPSVTGKPVYSDLHSRKKSQPVVSALNSGTAPGQELAELYHRERPMSNVDVEHAANLIDLAGGRAWSQSTTSDLVAQALRHLGSAGPSTYAAAELTALAGLITSRDH